MKGTTRSTPFKVFQRNSERETSGGHESDTSSIGDNGGLVDIELADTHPTPLDVFFVRDIEDINNDIVSITEATTQISKLQQQALRATKSSAEKAISERLQQVVDETNKLAKGAKDHLGVLQAENKNLLQNRAVRVADVKVRQNLCNAQMRKFIDAMKAYQAAQIQYKDAMTEKAKRQVGFMNPDLTDEQIEEIVQSQGGCEGFLQQTVLDGGIHEQVESAYSITANKYQDIVALEQSISQVHRIFVDLELLVDQQSEQLEQIDATVKAVGDDIEDADVELLEAIETRKRTCRRRFCLLFLVTVIVALLVFYFLVLA